MQQQTIRFSRQAEVPQPADVMAPIRERVQQVNRWLDSRSDFYSRLLGESITWRKALRIGVVLPIALVAVAVCAIQAPVVTAVSLASAGWIVYRLNSEEKKGGRR